MTCRCHADPSLYGSLHTCPGCLHRSFDPWAGACERRACGHQTAPRVEATRRVAPVLPARDLCDGSTGRRPSSGRVEPGALEPREDGETL